MPLFFSTLERCPSGLRYNLGKVAYRKVPGVRIPLSPININTTVESLVLKKTGDSNGKPRRASARKSKQDAYDSGLRRVGGANRTLATETESPSLRKDKCDNRIFSLKKAGDSNGKTRRVGEILRPLRNAQVLCKDGFSNPVRSGRKQQ